jgi:hypothetical protein
MKPIIVAALLALATAAPAGAQQPGKNAAGGLTAEQALEKERADLSHAIGTRRCTPAEADALLVCGRRGAGFGVPFPEERVEGERLALTSGEAPSAAHAYAATAQSPCTAVGRAQRCGGGISIFSAIMVAAKVVKALREQGD